MMKRYKEVEVTQENINAIKVGDYVRINDWNWGLKVIGVSNDFIILHNDKYEYSVVEKKPSETRLETFYRVVREVGMFHCGSTTDRPYTDVNGWDEGYAHRFIIRLKCGEARLDDSTTTPILKMWVK